MTDQSGILSLARTKISNLREIKGASNKWHGACPFCTSDDDGFVLWADNGNYWCNTCGKKGWATEFIMLTEGKSQKEAEAKLGIKFNGNGKHAVENSEISYHSRKHYAAVKGVPESVLINAKFKEIATYQGRPAMEYVTYDKDGKEWWRVRFMDGLKPKYKPVWISDDITVPAVWYRLQQAKGMSNKSGKPIVIVNGETSVLVARYYGIPAICKTGGEGPLPAHLLEELQTAYEKPHAQAKSRPREILIALDCDEKGRKTAKGIETQLKEGKFIPTVISLGFADTGDFADFCKLHTQDSAKRLDELVRAPKPVSSNAHDINNPVSLNVKDASAAFTSDILNKVAPEGKILLNPFKQLWHLGGDAQFMLPKRMTLIFAPSGKLKTSKWEAIVDQWQMHGHNGICEAPEIDKNGYHMRRLMRYAHHTLKDGKGIERELPLIKYGDVMFYQKHLQEERDNLPKHLRQGQAIFETEQGKGKLKTLSYVDKYVNSWLGHMEYTPPHIFIEDKIAWMKAWITKQREAGGHVEFAVFDYIQLFLARDATPGLHPYMYCLWLIKNFAIEMNVHVIVISQANKQPSKDAKANNTRLSIQDMAYIKESPANLVIGLNFYYAEQLDLAGNKRLDWNNDPIIKEKVLSNGHIAGIADVLKNSHGDTDAVKLQVDATHLRWTDEPWGATPLAI